MARESGQREGAVDLANVHLEQLPAYEPAREVAPDEEETGILSPMPTRPGDARDSGVSGVRSLQGESPKLEAHATPNEPPPDYEEAQVQAVGAEREQRRGTQTDTP